MLQDAIDSEDIAMLNAMVKVDEIVIESQFETGPFAGKFPMSYAEETGKIAAVAWFEQRIQDVDAFFTSGFQGKLFDASRRETAAIEQQLRDLEFSRAQETREVMHGAHGKLVSIAEAAVSSVRPTRL